MAVYFLVAPAHRCNFILARASDQLKLFKT
uniref:Uncharacterized protein n=1 Tax=Anguilla anguilla TaxID=7936 RepID=A0A0E9XPL4_ANGAN